MILYMILHNILYRTPSYEPNGRFLCDEQADETKSVDGALAQARTVAFIALVLSESFGLGLWFRD